MHKEMCQASGMTQLKCCSVIVIMTFNWWFDRSGATYSVEQSKQRTGSQTTAWRLHVSQFNPDITPRIISLHQSQWMLLVSEQRQRHGKWAVHSNYTVEAGDLIHQYMYGCMVGPNYSNALRCSLWNQIDKAEILIGVGNGVPFYLNWSHWQTSLHWFPSRNILRMLHFTSKKKKKKTELYDHK